MRNGSVKHRERFCARCPAVLDPKRSDRYCPECRAAYARGWRRKQAEELAELRRLAAEAHAST